MTEAQQEALELVREMAMVARDDGHPEISDELYRLIIRERRQHAKELDEAKAHEPRPLRSLVPTFTVLDGGRDEA